jgi:excinuclease UvrABC nuclease subunit
MVQTAADLKQLKGVGEILAKRLYDAGFDSFAKIAQAGEEGLKQVRGISPRAIGSILAQAKQFSESTQPGHAGRTEAVKKQLSEVQEKVHTLAQVTRERFTEALAGKSGKKLTSDLVRIEDVLVKMVDGSKKRSKRAGKALIKAEKRIAGLENASLKKVHKGLKRARKAMLKALK